MTAVQNTSVTSEAVVVDVDALFIWLRDLDIGACSLEGVNAAMAACRPVRGWLDVLDAKLRARDRELRTPIPPDGPDHESGDDEPGDHETGDDEPPGPPPPPPPPPPPLPDPPAGSGPGGNPLNDSAGIGHGEGRRRDRVSVVIDRFTGLDELLTQGRITIEHVHAICRAVHNLDARIDRALDVYAADIVAAAGTKSVRQLSRYLNQLITRIADQHNIDNPRHHPRSTLRHWADPTTGTGKIFADLNPSDYQRFHAALTTARNQIAGTHSGIEPEELAATAFLNLLGASSSATAIRTVTHVSVLIDADTLTAGPHGASICEYADGTPINPADLAHLTCSADRTPILLKDRVPLNVGRTQRLATSAQHRAIEALHTTCAIANCTTPVTMCQLHHIHHWESGGPTNIDNLIPLCNYHHHRSHVQRWQHTLHPDRSITTEIPRQLDHTTNPDRLERHHPSAA